MEDEKKPPLIKEENKPILFGLISFSMTIIAFYLGMKPPDCNAYAYFSALITIGSIFAGFSSASHALIMTNGDKVKMLRRSNVLMIFDKYTRTSLNSSVILIFAGISGFFKDISSFSLYIPFTVGMLVYVAQCVKRTRNCADLLNNYDEHDVPG